MHSDTFFFICRCHGDDGGFVSQVGEACASYISYVRCLVGRLSSTEQTEDLANVSISFSVYGIFSLAKLNEG